MVENILVKGEQYDIRRILFRDQREIYGGGCEQHSGTSGVQFNIIGEAQGIFYIEVKNGELSVEPYEYYDRDAMFTCTADTLRKIESGKLDPVAAVTLQKLKVEGNIDKALRFKELVDSYK